MEKYAGERVYLKLLEREDVNDRYCSWFNNETHLKYYSGSGKTFNPQLIIDDFERVDRSDNEFLYGIFDNSKELCIGNIRLGPIDQRNKTSDLVTMIGDTNYLGKGLAVDSIRLGNQVAFDVHDIRKLYGGMFENNVPSIKAYTRAGWVIEGRRIGQYYVDGKNMDRILVACFNPKYFDTAQIKERLKTDN